MTFLSNGSKPWAVLAAAMVLGPGVAIAQRSTPVTLVNQLQVEVSALPVAGVEPLEVYFHAAIAGGTAPYTYAWDFGDGGASSVPAPLYAYLGAGTYKAILKVTDADGNEVLGVVQVAVEADRVPDADVSAIPAQGIEPLTVQLAPVVTGGNPPFSYAWTVDGSPYSSQESPSVSFPVTATHTIGLEVTDADGDVALAQGFVEVLEDRPVVLMPVASDIGGPAPLTVQFDPGLIDGNPPVSFYWEFGEGTSSPLANPTFLFRDPGVYLVSVQATDANGDQQTATIAINVTAPP